jgi:hypothetical protein
MNQHRPISIAVALGLADPPLPPIESGSEASDLRDGPPPQLVQSLLHQGCKMILSGTSKSNKTWCLIDLALSVAAGQPWWGRPTLPAPVLYINLELSREFFVERVHAIVGARPELKNHSRNWNVWHLRGHSRDITDLRPRLQRYLDNYDLSLIVLDPVYKLLGNRDENANGDITSLMNEFERLAENTGAAIVISHHFAKGDPAVKDPIDRMSGAGVWARDPDSIVILTPHEEPGCFAVQMSLRNLPIQPDFVVAWQYPVMVPVTDLDPASIRRRKGRQKVLSDREFVTKVISGTPQSWGAILARAESGGIARTTATRYLKRLSEAGVISSGGGFYWVGEPEPELEAFPRLQSHK